MALETLSQRPAQRRLQLGGSGVVAFGRGKDGGQEVGAIAGIQAEHPVAAGAFEMAVLVLLAMAVIMQAMLGMVSAGAFS